MKKVIVTTSWDDGHVLDLKLAELLTKHNIKGTFYISPKNREFSSKERLNNKDIRTIAKKFEIGAHSMTHPHLSTLTSDKARKEIMDSKEHLQAIIKREITAFCYPYGDYSEMTRNLIEKGKFLLARTTKRFCYRTQNPLELPTTIHAYNHLSDAWNILVFSKFNIRKFINYLNWENLAKAQFDEIKKAGGTFHLWGHSWEIEKNNDWNKLERVLQYIQSSDAATHMTNSETVRYTMKTKRNILIVAPYFFPKTGGLENYIFNIAQGLKKQGHTITIATSNHKSNENITDYVKGIKVYRLAPLLKISNTPINPMWYFDIKTIIKKEQPDVINAQAPVPFIADVAAFSAGKIPFVLTYHAGSMTKNKFLFDVFIFVYQHVFLHLLFQRANQIICSSNFVRNTIAKNYMKKSFVISPGVNTKLFKPNSRIKKTNSILFVGRYANMYPMKGLSYLLEAMKDISNLQLRIVGEKANIVQKNVDFIGIKSGKNLVEEIQKSKALVLPSLAHMESFGMVLIEAMACKTPVIGTNIGGIPEIIDNNKNGILIPSKDTQSLKNAINKIMSDNSFSTKIKNNGYKKVMNEFTWPAQVKKTVNILNFV